MLIKPISFLRSASAPSGDVGETYGTHRYWRVFVNDNQSGPSTGPDAVSLSQLILRERPFGPGTVQRSDAVAMAISDSEFSGSFTDDHVFYGNNNEIWVSLDNNYGTHWIGADFGAGNEKEIIAVTLVNRQNFPTEAPVDFDIQYSDNGSTWTTAWNQTTPSTWTNSIEARSFTSPDWVGPDIAVYSQPSANHQLGLGDRTALITVSQNGFSFTGGLSNFVDNGFGTNTTDSLYFTTNQTIVTGDYIRYDFGRPVYLESFRCFQNITSTHGTWRIRGSNNATDWTVLSNDFTWGGAIVENFWPTLNNTYTFYRYYELYAVSGTVSGSPWLQETRFKIGSDIASVTHATLKSDLVFSGSVLTSAPASTGADFLVVTGSPAEGANGGWVSTEADTPSNYVYIDSSVVGLNVAYPSGVHVAVVYKRNATADDRTIMFGTVTGANYATAADSASTSTTTANGIGIRTVREEETSYGSGTTRQTLWNALYPDTDIRAMAVEDLADSSNLDIPLGRFATDSQWNFEGEILGVAIFTDWTEADAVQKWLIDEAT